MNEYPTFAEANADTTPVWWVFDPVNEPGEKPEYDVLFGGSLSEAKRLAAELGNDDLSLYIAMPILRYRWLTCYYNSSYVAYDLVWGHEVRDLYESVFGEPAPFVS